MPPFDPEVADKFLTAIRAGASNDVAALHSGVNLETVRDWLRGDTPVEQQFKADHDKARADLEIFAVGQIRQRVSEDQHAAMWFAERVHASQRQSSSE
jgi:hypothetical protein